MDDEKLLKILLQFSADKNSLEQVRTGAKSVASALKEIETQAQKTRERMERLESTSVRIGIAGLGILRIYQQQAAAYSKVATMSDEVGRRWIEANRRLEASNVRSGKIAAEAMTPYLNLMASVNETLASIGEKYPLLAKIGLAVGGAITAAGGTGAVIAQVGRIRSDTTQLLAARLQDAAANKQLTAAGLQGKTATANTVRDFAGGAWKWANSPLIPGAKTALDTAGRLASVTGKSTVAPALLGVPLTAAGGVSGASLAAALTPLTAVLGLLAGLGGYEALAQSKAGKNAGLANLGQYASVAAYGTGKALGGDRLGNEWFIAMAEMTNVMDAQSAAIARAAAEGKKYNALLDDPAIKAQAVQEYIDYEKEKAAAAAQYAEQVAEAEASAEKQRLQIIENFAEQAAEAERNYAQQSAKAQRDFAAANTQARRAYEKQQGQLATDFARQEKQAEAEYYRSRLEAAQNYAIDVQRAEQDHQRNMQQMQEDHNLRVNDLVAARDAFGLVKEQRAYERERSQAEGDYSLEAQRKNQDYARQMADLERSFAENRAQRMNDYQRQVAENEQNYREQRAQRAREFASQQQERAQQHAAEMAELKAKEAEQLKLLEESRQEQLDKLKNAYLKQSQLMQTAFVDRLNAMSKSILGDTRAYEKWMIDQSRRFESELNKLGFKLGSIPGKASGGSVFDGMTYLVGEDGPELFTAPRNGSIVPAGLTASLLDRRGGSSQTGQRQLTLKVESQTLTMSEILSEVDQRFARFERGLENSFA
jgi:hypothetical protein